MKFDLSTNIIFGLALEAVIGFILVLVTGPLGILLAKRLGVIDTPGTLAHKKHALPTPLAGGLILAIVFPILFGIFIFRNYPHLSWILLGSAIIFVFGLLDDKYGLSAPQKFAGQILAALIVMGSGVSVRILENFGYPPSPWLITVLDWTITLLWIVGITNAFNLVDSMDGLVTGLVAISASFLSATTIVSGQIELAQVTSILIGTSIGLYFYNRTPARLFLGDSGSQVFGFLLAVVSILYNPPDKPQGSTWFLPILFLGFPIFDTCLVIISRLRRHKPIFNADLSHTYHRLVRMGISPSRAVLIIHLAALLLAVIAYAIIFLPPKLASIAFAIIILLGISLVFSIEYKNKVKT